MRSISFDTQPYTVGEGLRSRVRSYSNMSTSVGHTLLLLQNMYV